METRRGHRPKTSTTAPAASDPPRPRRVRKWFFRLVAGFLLLGFGYGGWIFGQVWWLRDHNPETTAFMEQGLERLRERNPRAQLQHRWVPYERISFELKRAVIAAEDQKFLEHEGFDVEAIEEARKPETRARRIDNAVRTILQKPKRKR